ncbi:MAG: alpha/beta fold hydrolase [Deltaproteobacteria bacterium]|nr:alpha/beta fold hydrolase [Deltaproteobacteria bacterium]
MKQQTALEHRDATGVFVRTSQGEVHVVVDGDPADPAVCCIHGLPGSARDFRALAKELASRGLCAVRIDVPGFGRSPAGPTLLTSPAARAGLIAEVMQARGHRTFAVAGHSFGGTAALATAALYADRVSALVLVNSIGITRHRGLTLPHELTRQARHVAKLPVLGPRLVAAIQRGYGRLGIRAEEPIDADDVVAHTQLVGGLDFADLRAFAVRVRAPALVVSSSDDRVVEAVVSFTLAQALSSTTLTSHRHSERGGHLMQKHDAPAIASWLQARLHSAP